MSKRRWLGYVSMFLRNRPSEKAKHTVDHAGSRHRYYKASIHTTIKEANRRELRLVFVAHETITLVACLCCVYWEDLVVVISPETHINFCESFDIHKPKK